MVDAWLVSARVTENTTILLLVTHLLLTPPPNSISPCRTYVTLTIITLTLVPGVAISCPQTVQETIQIYAGVIGKAIAYGL